MRLLIVTQYFWPETFRVNDLVSGLIARGHDVTVLTGEPNYPDGVIYEHYRRDKDAYSVFDNADVVRVPIIARGKGHLRLILNYLSFVVSGALFGTFKLRRRKFDAIFVFQTSPITSALPALWMRRRKRAPVLMWVLDLWPETLSAIGVVRSPRLIAIVGSLVRFIYKRCDLILVQSTAFYDNVVKYAGGLEKVRYFPGWAEPVFSDPQLAPTPAAELAPYEANFKLLFAGNIGEAQDFPAILDAAEALCKEPRLRWLIVGDGRAAPMLRAEIAKRGLGEQVILLGRFPLHRMPSFFAGADALLVSLRREAIWELTIPGKVQSYLAAGKPLLGMIDGAGARVIEESGAGLAAPAGDGKALAVNVLTMMSIAEGDRERMGQAGQDYNEQHFNRDRLFDKLESWLAESAVRK